MVTKTTMMMMMLLSACVMGAVKHITYIIAVRSPDNPVR